jgi:peroxiredoxin
MIETDQPAPVFSLPDLHGRECSLADLRGRVVVINFWSAVCPHAARVDAAILELLPTWDGRVALLTIAANANEPLELLQQEASRRGLPVVLHDEQRLLAERYAALTTPHLFLIDRCGILRYQGAFDDVTFRQRQATQAYLQQAVEAVLAGRLPEPSQTPPYGCTIVRYLFGEG